MKKIYQIVSLVLICSLLISGCGKVENSSSKQDSKETNAASSTEQPTVSETPTASPVPTTGTFSSKQNYSDADREVSILGLKEYKKLKSEKYTDKAGEGKKFLVLFLKIRNRGVDEEYFNVNNLTAKLDGKKIENTFLFNEPEGYPTIFNKIEAEKTVAGFIVWKVPENWKKLQVSYTGWKDSDGLSLETSLTKKDLKKPQKYNKTLYQ